MEEMARARITQQRMRDGTIRFRLRGTKDGIEESLGLYDTLDEANGQKAAWLALNDDAPDGLTLRAWGLQWLALRETDGAHRNARGDRSRWMRYVHDDPIADILVARLETKHVVTWLDRVVRLDPVRAITKGGETVRKPRGGRLSRQTVKHALRLMSVALSDAATRGHCKVSPAAGVKAPAIVDPPGDKWSWLRTHEIAALEAMPVSKKLRRSADGADAQSLTPKQRAAFILAIYTGLREGEIWGLRWCDVRLEGDAPEVYVQRSFRGEPKSKRSIRHVPLFPKAVAELVAWRKLRPGIGEAFVFPTDGSGAKELRDKVRGGCHGRGYDAGWEQIAAMLKIGARFHDLRHTCASHLVQGTWTPQPMSLIEVRDWMGHESIKTTERYAHLADRGLHAAIKRGATVTTIETKRRKR